MRAAGRARQPACRRVRRLAGYGSAAADSDRTALRVICHIPRKAGSGRPSRSPVRSWRTCSPLPRRGAAQSIRTDSDAPGRDPTACRADRRKERAWPAGKSAPTPRTWVGVRPRFARDTRVGACRRTRPLSESGPRKV